MKHSISVSSALLQQIIFSLERRLVDLNSRGSEPTDGAIACTHAALELTKEAYSDCIGLL